MTVTVTLPGPGEDRQAGRRFAEAKQINPSDISHMAKQAAAAGRPPDYVLGMADFVCDVYPNAWAGFYVRGTVALKSNAADAGLRDLRRASALAPNNTRLMAVLGAALRGTGDTAAAVTLYQRHLQKSPRTPNILCNLSVALSELGRLEEAEAAARQAVTVKPDMIEGWINLAAAARLQQKLRPALDALDKALAIDPVNPNALTGKALILSELGHYEKAGKIARAVTKIEPGFVDAWAVAAASEVFEGRPANAATLLCQNKAVRQTRLATTVLAFAVALNRQTDDARRLLAPVSPQTDAERLFHALASAQALIGEDRHGDARALLDRIDGPLGRNLHLLRMRLATATDPEARDRMERDVITAVLAADPEHRAARLAMSYEPLRDGRWRDGADDYGHRHVVNHRIDITAFVDRRVTHDRILDALRAPGSIVIWAEQALGDQILAIRAVKHAIAAHRPKGPIAFAVAAGLVDLFRRSLPELQVMSHEEATDGYFDVGLYAFDLIFALGWTPADIRPESGVLIPNPDLVADWRHRLRDRYGPNPVVALIWGGSRLAKADQMRSIPATAFRGFANTPNVTLINPMYRSDGDIGSGVVVHKLGSELHGFDAVAAVMANCAHVVCCDSGAGVLAGAIDTPTQFLTMDPPYWLWGPKQSPCVWYKSWTLLHKQPGDWFQTVEVARRNVEANLPPPAAPAP